MFKTTAVLVAAFIAVLAAVLLVQEPGQRPVNTVQEQPGREPYVPPTWVTNERGQRCIKQGDTVTCG